MPIRESNLGKYMHEMNLKHGDKPLIKAISNKKIDLMAGWNM